MGYAIIDEVDEISKVIHNTRLDHLGFLRHLSGVPDSGISVKNSFPLGDSGPLEEGFDNFVFWSYWGLHDLNAIVGLSDFRKSPFFRGLVLDAAHQVSYVIEEDGGQRSK